MTKAGPVRVQTVVVGAGVVGLACARALALAGHEVVLVEAQAGVGRGTSSRNSGVIHAGLYYPGGSHKARLCVRGAALLYAYCAERGVAHARTGKWILATDEAEVDALTALHDNALANGVSGLERVDAETLRRREPTLRAAAALFSENTGVVDTHGLMEALLSDARRLGVTLLLGRSLTAISANDGVYEIRLQGPQSPGAADTEEGVERVVAECVVNACGLHADAVARQVRARVGGRAARHHYYRGDYLSVGAGAPRPNTALVYPLPGAHGLGVHLTRDLGGTLRAGPDAYPVAQPDVSLGLLDEQAWQRKAELFARALRRFLPGIEPEHLSPEFAGIRPKLFDAPEITGGATDFGLWSPDTCGTPRMVHLLGIESPGLTASLAIAEWVAETLETRTKAVYP